MIIAFTGNAGCGKSTAAKFLKGKHLSFADPIKQMLRVIGISDAALYGNEKELPQNILGGKTARYAMQTLGTEWGRHLIDHNIWVAVMMDQLLRQKREAPFVDVIIDDLRFQNEADMLKAMGAAIIRIHRFMPKEQSHHSEQELNFIRADDYIANENLSLDEYKRIVNNTVERLRKDF